jgi:hypothetical protein
MKNNLEISFDYHKPDIAVLTVFKTSNAFLYTTPSVQIIKTLIGREAIETYSKITGKPIEDIERDSEGATE